MREKKLQVFVSSTYLDLKEERQAAVEAILQAGHIPAGMELFTAGDQSQWTVIKRWIDESDVYLLLLGGRYGSVDPITEKSYTQLEFEYAVETGKARFSLVLSEKFIDEKVRHSGRDMIETMYGVNLKAFRSVVTSSLVKFCEDIKDIKLATTNSLYEFDHDDRLIGWVRGNRGVDTALLAEQIAKLSQENSYLRTTIANQENQGSALYNGLTYKELSSLLHQVKIELDDITDLFELLLEIGFNKKSLTSFPNYNIENKSKLVRYIKALEKFKVVTYDGYYDFVILTDEGHKFFLKALSELNKTA
jgi:hypothetical protein